VDQLGQRMPHLTLSNVNQACTPQSARSRPLTASEEGGQQFSAVLVRDETAAMQELVLAVFLISAG